MTEFQIARTNCSIRFSGLGAKVQFRISISRMEFLGEGCDGNSLEIGKQIIFASVAQKRRSLQ
jgi:hypothetical protein